MGGDKTIVGLDIGSSKIRAVVGRVNEKQSTIDVIGTGVAESNGIRKGLVTDMEEAVLNITSALEDAERMAGEPIHRVFIGLSGTHLETFDSRGVIAIGGQNSEISEDDVNRVLDAAQAVSLPSNRSILRIIPRSFSVDAQRDIKYPIGMSGIRLEVEASILTGQTPAIKNMEKCLFQAGIDTEDLVPSILASAESVLDRKQKELGVILIEIGSGCTNIAIFEEGIVTYSTVIPVGSEHVTNDIAIGLRCSVDTADKVKIQYGNCSPDSVDKREDINLAELSQADAHIVSKKQVAQIVEARYNEILLMIRDELVKISRDGMLPSGIVLCGGGSKIPGVIDLARETLALPAQLGFPKDLGGVVDRVDDPVFATATGLLHFGHRHGPQDSLFRLDSLFGFFDIKKWFRGLLP